MTKTLLIWIENLFWCHSSLSLAQKKTKKGCCLVSFFFPREFFCADVVMNNKWKLFKNSTLFEKWCFKHQWKEWRRLIFLIKVYFNEKKYFNSMVKVGLHRKRHKRFSPTVVFVLYIDELGSRRRWTIGKQLFFYHLSYIYLCSPPSSIEQYQSKGTDTLNITIFGESARKVKLYLIITLICDR